MKQLKQLCKNRMWKLWKPVLTYIVTPNPDCLWTRVAQTKSSNAVALCVASLFVERSGAVNLSMTPSFDQLNRPLNRTWNRSKLWAEPPGRGPRHVRNSPLSAFLHHSYNRFKHNCLANFGKVAFCVSRLTLDFACLLPRWAYSNYI